MTFYCHSCASDLGHLRSIHTSSLTGTTYQLDKYIKHTIPDPAYDVQSLFADPSTEAYANYVLDATAAGSVEFDSLNRRNVVWVAGETVGFGLRGGIVQQPQNAVKVVLSSETDRIHAYPESSTKFSTCTCSQCGSSAIT
jgi:hypothetical protein